jgi:hypothetical protein
MGSNPFELPEIDEDIESIEEIQTSVLLVNERLAEIRSGDEFETSGVGFDIDSNVLAEEVEGWLSDLRSRVDAIAEQNGASSYTVSVSGGLTGGSVGISVTYETQGTVEN